VFERSKEITLWGEALILRGTWPTTTALRINTFFVRFHSRLPTTQLTLEPLPVQLSVSELLVKVALIAILPSADRNVRLELLMLRVPVGLVTVLPVLVNPP
jgi:hypothetical protein